MSCSECTEKGRNKKWTCMKHGESWDLVDFYRNKVKVINLTELYNLYIIFTDQQKKKLMKDMPGLKDPGRDTFLDWCKKRLVCPLGIITENSYYWIETIAICDSEYSLNTPYGVVDTPDIFYQALGIIRKEKAEIQQEEASGNKKNNN